MRARSFRPNFDRLDVRLVLSDLTPLPTTPGSLPGDEIDPVAIVNDSSTSNDSTDPMNPSIPVMYTAPVASTS